MCTANTVATTVTSIPKIRTIVAFCTARPDAQRKTCIPKRVMPNHSGAETITAKTMPSTALSSVSLLSAFILLSHISVFLTLGGQVTIVQAVSV